jgi:hypothetical protein
MLFAAERGPSEPILFRRANRAIAFADHTKKADSEPKTEFLRHGITRSPRQTCE